MQHQTVYVDGNGVRRTLHWREDEPDRFGVNTEVDVEQLVKNNAALAELHPQGSTNKLVARVPLTIYERSVHENWDDEQWKRWLNDPDNKAFRIWPGRV
jgi:hypothetical protein